MGEQLRFLVTPELGKLAKWLRILGFDAAYARETVKSRLYITALQENRIILTRDKRLGGRPGMRTVFIHAEFLTEQLRQVITELSLPVFADKFFQRCVICNRLLLPAEKESVRAKVPVYIFQTRDVFFICPACGRVYWKGTHWGNIEKMIKIIRDK